MAIRSKAESSSAKERTSRLGVAISETLSCQKVLMRSGSLITANATALIAPTDVPEIASILSMIPLSASAFHTPA